MVDGAKSGAFEETRFNDVEALAGGSRKKSCGRGRQRDRGGLFLCRMIFGIARNLNGERRGGLAGCVDDGFEFDGFTGQI